MGEQDVNRFKSGFYPPVFFKPDNWSCYVVT